LLGQHGMRQSAARHHDRMSPVGDLNRFADYWGIMAITLGSKSRRAVSILDVRVDITY